MSWVCALCNLCILLTRDPTPPPPHWVAGYRDMLGTINQPECKANVEINVFVQFKWVVLCNVSGKTDTSNQIFGTNMCDNNNIYMCPPVNVLYHIVYIDIYSWVHWYFGLKILYFVIFFIAHFSMHYQLQLHYRIWQMTKNSPNTTI